jgi:uncharacterized protein
MISDPAYGLNKPSVIDSLIEPLHDRGYHVLCYNSRGVGKSTGWASFTGLSEGKDLEAIVQWGLQAVSKVQSLVVIVSSLKIYPCFISINFTLQGYSYGSLIASLLPILRPLVQTSHILLSYPLGKRGLLTLFNTRTYSSSLSQLLQDPSSNVLIIFGDRDEFTSGDQYDSWSEGLNTDAERKGRLEVVKVEGGSHFWRGSHGRLMTAAVMRWLP